jgi:hypothetical protein
MHMQLNRDKLNSEGQAWSVSLVKPGAYLSVSYAVTQPYQRWLGVAPSSRYAILMRLR